MMYKLILIDCQAPGWANGWEEEGREAAGLSSTGFMVLQMSADGRVYAYGVERILSQLHFVTGLR